MNEKEKFLFWCWPLINYGKIICVQNITHAGNIINGRCHWCFLCNSKHSVSNLPRTKVLSIFVCQSYLFNNSDFPWDDICKLSCRRHCGVNTNAILTINYLNARKTRPLISIIKLSAGSVTYGSAFRQNLWNSRYLSFINTIVVHLRDRCRHLDREI